MSMIDTNCPIAWPALDETQATDDWEVVDMIDQSPSKGVGVGVRAASSRIPKSISTPDFGNYDFVFEEESVATSVAGDESDVVVEDESESDICVVDTTTAIAGDSPVKVMKRVPSFKDAILLNAQECERLEAEAKKKEAMTRRVPPKKRVPTFSVRKIRRNAHSMTDLASLAEADHEDDELEVNGDADAPEFYARKSKGSTARANSTKLRPDEAKRREFILYKKNVQRARNG